MPKTRNFSQTHIVDSVVEDMIDKLPWWLKLLAKILLVDLIIAHLVAGLSCLTQDFSLLSLSNRLFGGGVIAILISVASGIGNWGNRSDWQQMLAQSAGQANLTERNSRMMADIAQVYALAFVMIPAGLLAILIAVILGQYA